MRIPTMQLAKLTEVEANDVHRDRERENEPLRLAELMKCLQTMIRQREQRPAQEAA